MNKKILTGLIAVAIIIIAAIFFLSPQKNTEKELYGYAIKTDGSSKIIENKSAKLEMKVPTSWRDTPISLSGGKYQIDFFSPEALEQVEDGPIQQGCKLTTLVVAEKTSIEELQNKFNAAVQENQPTNYKSEIINISGLEAFKSTVEYIPGIAVVVEIPVGENLYSFIMYPGVNSVERCNNDFDQFIKTLSIKK